MWCVFSLVSPRLNCSRIFGEAASSFKEQECFPIALGFVWQCGLVTISDVNSEIYLLQLLWGEFGCCVAPANSFLSSEQEI